MEWDRSHPAIITFWRSIHLIKHMQMANEATYKHSVYLGLIPQPSVCTNSKISVSVTVRPDDIPSIFTIVAAYRNWPLFPYQWLFSRILGYIRNFTMSITILVICCFHLLSIYCKFISKIKFIYFFKYICLESERYIFFNMDVI